MLNKILQIIVGVKMNKTKQKDIFSTSEGDEWFNRNLNSIVEQKNDKIVQIIKSIELFPQKVLEIGCSSGERLELIRNTFGSECYGIDPSSKAIEDGNKKHHEVSLSVGTADYLQFEDNSFDTIIFGFCLYLCDRKDLFKIAYEADRCLKNKGTLIIKDFQPTFAYKNKYSHFKGVYSYKMDYSKMFKWNPAYTEVANVVFSHSGFELRDIPDEKIAIVVLRKNEKFAYPEEPFK
ncbi:MAG: class I SAM-dependent methyltransferase [Flavobacteriaceae bacterium]|nr:class I SAM-dependent methyltransferase [Flavobacteriaceae bacterium]